MGHCNVKACKPFGGKFMRARAQTASFEGGFVKLPEQAAWRDAYVLELTTFPRGRFEDQVDSTSQVLGWMAPNAVEPALLTHYHRMYEESLYE